jgi:hypothetical protein
MAAGPGSSAWELRWLAWEVWGGWGREGRRAGNLKDLVVQYVRQSDDRAMGVRKHTKRTKV